MMNGLAFFPKKLGYVPLLSKFLFDLQVSDSFN